MNQPMDPRLGNRRKKALLQKIAAQAIQRRGSTLGRFGKLGVSRGSYAGTKGGGGSRMLGQGQSARPFGNLNTLQALGVGRNPHARFEVPSAQASPRVAAPAPLPAALPGGLLPNPTAGLQSGDYIAPAEPGSNFLAPTDPLPGDPGQGGVATGNPEYNQWAAGQFENVWNFQNTQAAPADPLTIGGMIPLGGGVYLDPETGVVHGGGVSGRMMA